MLEHEGNAMARIRVHSTIILLVLIAPADGMCQTALPEIGQIAATLSKGAAQIASAKVSIETVAESEVPHALLIKHSQLFGLSKSNTEVAFSAERRFQHSIDMIQPLTSPSLPFRQKFEDGVEVKDDSDALTPRQVPKTTIYDGKVVYIQHEDSTQVVELDAFRDRSGFLFAEPYFRYSSWFVADPTNSSTLEAKRRQGIVPDIFREGDWSVSAAEVPGKSLILLERLNTSPNSSKERIWVDPAHGYMVTRRELYKPGSEGRLIASLDATKPIRLLNDFHVPSEITLQEFPPDSALGEYDPTQVWVTTKIRATVTDVNAVDESLFNPPIKAGDRVVSIGDNPYDEKPSVRPMVADADGKILDASLAELDKQSRSPFFLYLNIAAIAILVVLIVFYRVRSKSAS